MGICLSCCDPAQDNSNNHQLPSLSQKQGGDNKDSTTHPQALSQSNSNQKMVDDAPSSKGFLDKRASGFISRLPILPGSSSSNSDSKHHREFNETKCNSLFDQYKDDHEDAILSDGIERLCHDLNVKPDEFKVLLLAWRLEAETMCRFTRLEFVNGLKKLKVDNIKDLQAVLPDIVNEVQEDPDKFKSLYRFTFKFGLDNEIGQRNLPLDMAMCLWTLVFSINEPFILRKWLKFIEKNPSIRGITRDTWNMFLLFCESVGNDLSLYDEDKAWPSLFDDFVEYENDQTNQNVQHKEDSE